MSAVREVSTKKDVRLAVAIPPRARSLREPGSAAAATAATVGSSGQGLYKQEAGGIRGVRRDSDRAGRRRRAAGALDRGRSSAGDEPRRELITAVRTNLPRELRRRARQAAADFGRAARSSTKGLRHERFGSMLAVAQGSERRADGRARNRAAPRRPRAGLVGKGSRSTAAASR